MRNRIKQLRTYFNMTQSEFADALAVKRSTVANWETVDNSLSNRSILIICKEFNVREEWLRYGDGDMFIEPSRDERITRFINSLQLAKDDSFKKRLINVLIELDDDQWDLLADMAIKLYKNQ